jgi:hypothetical protein
VSFYNPFQSAELVYPGKYRDWVDRYTQTQPGGGSRPSPDTNPFSRVVDLWFLALCIGYQAGRRKPVEEPHKFITGEILSRDSWRIELLEFIALDNRRSGEALESPNETIALANEYAAAGISDVFDMLERGQAHPIWNLTDGINDLLATQLDSR